MRLQGSQLARHPHRFQVHVENLKQERQMHGDVRREAGAGHVESVLRLWVLHIKALPRVHVPPAQDDAHGLELAEAIRREDFRHALPVDLLGRGVCAKLQVESTQLGGGRDVGKRADDGVWREVVRVYVVIYVEVAQRGVRSAVEEGLRRSCVA